ncbi:MAG: hypothetical protein ACLTQG_30725 [Hungatella sp.]|uniref:hypothetical protein n=1 Tax=Hungatella sp. TaxID=2613924 RepID=UPI0039957F3A
MSAVHSDEAFWIQTRVLKWAGYPEVKTMDQYFDLIRKTITKQILPWKTGRQTYRLYNPLR